MNVLLILVAFAIFVSFGIINYRLESPKSQ